MQNLMQEQIQLAQQAVQTGQYELAASIWKSLIELAPDAETQRDFALAYSDVLIVMRQFPEARKLLKQLYAETYQPRYLQKMAQLERDAGADQQALETLQTEAELLTEPEDKVRNALDRGACAISLGQNRYALACAEEALQELEFFKDPSAEAAAQTLKGEVALNQSEFEQARQAFAQAAVAYATAGNSEAEQALANRIAELP